MSGNTRNANVSVEKQRALVLDPHDHSVRVEEWERAAPGAYSERGGVVRGRKVIVHIGHSFVEDDLFAVLGEPEFVRLVTCVFSRYEDNSLDETHMCEIGFFIRERVRCYVEAQNLFGPIWCEDTAELMHRWLASGKSLRETSDSWRQYQCAPDGFNGGFVCDSDAYHHVVTRMLKQYGVLRSHEPAEKPSDFLSNQERLRRTS